MNNLLLIIIFIGIVFFIYNMNKPKPSNTPIRKLPDWLKTSLPKGDNYFHLKTLVETKGKEKQEIDKARSKTSKSSIARPSIKPKFKR